MDPITIMTVASTAFNALKQGIEYGKQIEDMAGSLSKWSGAISDLEFLDRKAQNPPWWAALGSDTQGQAIEIFAAKKKAQAMRDELRTYVNFQYGPSAWDEILRIEAQVRKQKQQHEYRKQEIKEAIINWTIGILLFITMVSGFAGGVWYFATH